MLSVIVLTLLVYGIFRWRLQRLRQSELRLKTIVTERTKEIRQQKDKIEQQAGKLKELNTTQSRWFTNIAHELRTPLTLVLGPTRQLLKTNSQKTKEELTYLQLVESNSESLLKLVNQIMDISRMESGRIQLQKEPIQLHHTVEVAVANFETFAHQKRVRLTTDIQAYIIVHIDEKRIQNILINLISNAFKIHSCRWNGSYIRSA